MNKNEFVKVEITDMSTVGEGIGHIDGCTLFVQGAVIGDTVRACVTYVKKNCAYASAREILIPSKDRVTPLCPAFGRCGGCTLQNLSYPSQLIFKRNLVANALKRIGGLDAEVPPVIGMDEPFRYRNKAQFPTGVDSSGSPVVGFYAIGTHDLVPIADCYLQPEGDRRILKIILEYMKKYQIPPYDEKTGGGLVRHILIRKAYATGETMVCLVINKVALPHAEYLTDALKELPGIKSICLNVNSKRGNVILGNEVRPLFGDAYITDCIGNLSFRISPQSFYQVNPVQTKKLYDQVKTFAALTGKETILDLYCGIGTIGLYLAGQAKRVIGVEVVAEAVRDANQNAKRNHIDNADFIAGTSELVIDELPPADVIVIDPPRKGCAEKLLQVLISKAPKKLIYVSCNPATLARDLKILTDGGFQIAGLQPFDMFPETQHLETCALLVKVSVNEA